MISRDTIEEVLMRTDIQSLISSYVSLKRAGSNLKGLCPFHSEKSPSFTVYPANNSFYCFGCGAGGDQLSFIMKAEHLDYPDAISFLAKRAGITIIEDEQTTSSTPKYNKDRFYKMNADAARFFNSYLFSNNPDAQNALAYFVEKRKMSKSTIQHFGLGFAPDSFDKFLRHMRSLGYSEEELVVGNLCRKSEKGGVFDSFRNRVMFPVIDVSGNVIAFGGRVMDDSKPKYLNSSDTPVFKKSRNLFALNFAKNSCQGALILCEGYMDVIALHASGITNAVATLGTAITAEQARLISRYTKRVVISYDADEAGQMATQKAIRLLEEVSVEVSVLSIPGAKDPDEYIKTYGVEKFKEVIGVAKSKFDFKFDSIVSKYDLTRPQDRIDALHSVEKVISAIYSAAERDVYIQYTSEKFGIPFASIKADVDKFVAKNARDNKRAENQRNIETSIGYQDKINPDFIKAPAIARNEENVLGLLLLYPDHRKTVFDQQLLKEDDFYTELNRKIFNFIKKCYDEGDEMFIGLNQEFSEEEVGRISKIKIERMQFENNNNDILLEMIESLKSSMDKKKLQNVDTVDALAELLRKKREE